MKTLLERLIRLIATEKVSDEMIRESRFQKAKALLAMNKERSSIRSVLGVVAESVKSLRGAESKYHMVEILFLKADYEKAESEVFSFAEKNTPHQYWMAKEFILLAQIYVKKNDLFQAKVTLQSVIDGYTNSSDGIIDAASAMQVELIKKEKEMLLPSSSESDQIKMNQ